jgi:predicted RNase H-like HicB family nuclease
MGQIVLYTDEDGAWCAMCPSLPGCFSDGKTKEEAITNIREAIELWIEDAQANDEPVPSERFDAVIMIIEETPAVVK